MTVTGTQGLIEVARRLSPKDNVTLRESQRRGLFRTEYAGETLREHRGRARRRTRLLPGWSSRGRESAQAPGFRPTGETRAPARVRGAGGR